MKYQSALILLGAAAVAAVKLSIPSLEGSENEVLPGQNVSVKLAFEEHARGVCLKVNGQEVKKWISSKRGTEKNLQIQVPEGCREVLVQASATMISSGERVVDCATLRVRVEEEEDVEEVGEEQTQQENVQNEVLDVEEQTQQLDNVQSENAKENVESLSNELQSNQPNYPFLKINSINLPDSPNPYSEGNWNATATYPPYESPRDSPVPFFPRQSSFEGHQAPSFSSSPVLQETAIEDASCDSWNCNVSNEYQSEYSAIDNDQGQDTQIDEDANATADEVYSAEALSNEEHSNTLEEDSSVVAQAQEPFDEVEQLSSTLRKACFEDSLDCECPPLENAQGEREESSTETETEDEDEEIVNYSEVKYDRDEYSTFPNDDEGEESTTETEELEIEDISDKESDSVEFKEEKEVSYTKEIPDNEFSPEATQDHSDENSTSSSTEERESELAEAKSKLMRPVHSQILAAANSEPQGYNEPQANSNLNGKGPSKYVPITAIPEVAAKESLFGSVHHEIAKNVPHIYDGTAAIRRFEWRLGSGGAKSVRIAGSFDGWDKGIEMHQDAESGDFVAEIPWTGKGFQFKFVVDGHRWMISPLYASEWDDQGNLNNVCWE